MFTHEMIKSFNQLEMDVYNYIISNEEKVVYMKVRELAEAVHVSTTTILRFCKKVGCEGYSEFRLKLKQEVSSKEQKKINMDLTAVKDFFERVQTQAFAENIQEAVKLLTKASSIIFVGVGNSSFIGKYGARYFNNVGWFSFAIDDPFTPVFRGKGERTATIALSVSGETEQTLMLAEKLKRRGSSLISITNKANCSLAKMSDCNINYYVSQYKYKEDENYYLLAYDHKAEMIKYFRVDKLRQLKREEGKREGETAYQKLDVTDFSKKTFGMFAGEKKRLQLVFDNSLIGVAIDRFGKEIPVLKESETQFRTFVEISVSKQFYGWLAGIGKGVSIVEPKEEQEKYRKYLENIWKL